MFGNMQDVTPFGRRQFGERLEAQKRWPFLTSRDLDRISTERDLCAVICRNTGSEVVETAATVRTWMTEHFVRLGSPSTKEPVEPAPLHQSIGEDRQK